MQKFRCAHCGHEIGVMSPIDGHPSNGVKLFREQGTWKCECGSTCLEPEGPITEVA